MPPPRKTPPVASIRSAEVPRLGSVDRTNRSSALTHTGSAPSMRSGTRPRAGSSANRSVSAGGSGCPDRWPEEAVDRAPARSRRGCAPSSRGPSRARCPPCRSASRRFRGAKSAWPPSVAKGRCRSPSQNSPASPRPVPAEMIAWLPDRAFAPGCRMREVGRPEVPEPVGVGLQVVEQRHPGHAEHVRQPRARPPPRGGSASRCARPSPAPPPRAPRRSPPGRASSTNAGRWSRGPGPRLG